MVYVHGIRLHIPFLIKVTSNETLIKNGICTWDSFTNSAVFPDNIKENLMYLPPNEIQDTDDYQYTEPASDETKTSGVNPTGDKIE